MFEETVIPSVWASMISWFTPTILFILLNIMIGTIAVTSRFANQKPHQQTREEEDHHHVHQQQRFHQQLVRAPSNVIQRLKSINLYHFKTEDLNPFSSFSSHDHPHEQRVVEETHQDHQPSVIQRLKSINLYSFKVEDLNPFHHDHKLDETQAADHAHQQQQQQQLPQSRLARAPSNVIQRLKSINLSDLNPFPTFQQQPQSQPPPAQMINHGIKKTKTPIRKQREISPHDIDEFDHHHHHHQEVRRSNSDRRPTKLVSQKDKMIKKSMSEKLDFWNFGNRAEEEEEETEEVVAVRGRRPSNVKVTRETTTTTTTKVKVKASESERFGDEEVDAKADDFISRFKHQLKLQRLDSIMRNKDDLAAGRPAGRG